MLSTPRQFWPTSEPMQINLPAPQSKEPHPTSPSQRLTQTQPSVLQWPKKTNQNLNKKESLKREKLKQYLSILQRLRRLWIYNKIAHVPKAPFKLQWLRRTLFHHHTLTKQLTVWIRARPPSVPARLPRINHEPGVEIKHCSSTTKME